MIIEIPDSTPIIKLIKLAADLDLQLRFRAEGGFTTVPKPPTPPKVVSIESARQKARV